MEPHRTHKVIRGLLEKAKHYDKDERYMATSDLKAELEKVQGQIDADLQIPIREMVLTQLDDGSDEVQSIAVSCLSAIITKFKNSEIFEISQKLGKSLIEGKSEMKDSYSDGLQNIINAVDISLAEGIGERIMVNLLRGLNDINPEERDTINFVLNVLEALLNRFGSKLGKYHEEVLNALLPLLESENVTLRKRGAVALAALVRSLDDALFEKLISAVIAKIDVTRNEAKLYNYIQTIGIVGRNAGVRIGKHLYRIVPLLVSFCTDESDSGRSAEETTNLRENCLQAFESLIRECPSDITTHIDSLVSLALEFISHDPNWAGEDGKQSQKDEDGDTNMEDDGDAGFGEDDDDDGFGDDGGDWDDGDVQFDDDGGGDGGKPEEGWEDVGAVTHDDDDEAWRVRRAAVKVVASFIATASSSVLLEKFNALSNALVDRFTDRDIDVKVEVFHAIRDLMSSTVRKEESSETPLDAPTLMRLPSIGDVPNLVRSQSAGLLLEDHVSGILSGILAQLKTSQSKTKSGAFSVLRELIIVRDGGLETWLGEIFERVAESCTDRDTVLREKALDLLELLVTKHRVATCRKYIPSLVACIEASVSSKTGATTDCRVQAFRCIEACVKALRPDTEAMLTGEESLDSVKAFYDAALEQMKLLDVEQSIKVASISAVAAILVRFGDSLPHEALPLFLDRLDNRVTRLAALRAFVALSQSTLNIDLSSVKQRALKVIVQFLKQASPEVTHEAAAALKALLQSNDQKGDVSGIYRELLADVADFISPKDFFLSHLVLDVISTMLEAQPSLVIGDNVISQCFLLLESPLLQQSEALPSLQRFFAGLLHSTASKQTYDQLLKKMTDIVKPGLSHESFTSISQCVAAISMVSSQGDQDKTVQRFVSEVESKDDSISQMALLSLGEIGRRKDLSTSLVGKAVFKAFSKEQTELKMAASFALGCISVSNLAFYLNDLLEKIDKAPKFRYLLLNSLKEVVNYHYLKYDRIPKLRKYSSIVLPVLLNNSVSKDEGEQNLLAECLGKMIIVDPQNTMPRVEGNLSVPDANTRAVMVASMKYSLSGGPEIQGLLREKMERFLNLMNDDHYQEWLCARCKARNSADAMYCKVASCKETRIVLPVERQAFLTFNAILKDNIQLVSVFLHKDHLEQNASAPLCRGYSAPLRAVYTACIYRKELLKEIELGATKIRQDQGLPLRKAAFACMEHLARNAYRWLNFNDYISYLSNGLKDPNLDILVLAYQIFQRLARSRGANILSEINTLPDYFLVGLKEQLKMVKQKNPQAEHIKTVVLTEAMRALQAINDIPGCQSLSYFQKFMKKVMKTPTLVEIRNKMRAADMKTKQKNAA